MRAARLSASLPTSGITYAYLGFYAGHLQVSGIFFVQFKKNNYICNFLQKTLDKYNHDYIMYIVKRKQK